MPTQIPTAHDTGTAPAKPDLLPGIVRASPRAVHTERALALVLVLGPLVGTVVAVVLLWGVAVGVTELVLLIVMYSLATLGLGIGFHRLAAHRSFQTSTNVRVLFAILGSMAGQGPVLYWAANHRRHHKYSDHPGDPHSPHLHGGGAWGLVKGFWHVHVGWLFTDVASDWRYWIPDLLRDRALFKVNQSYFIWLLAGLFLPAVAGGIVYALAGESPWWLGALLGFLWGGLVRMFLEHQSSWAINSVTHLWGTRPYRTHDHSRNNVLVALATFGEGWHNNHHAFPSSAFNGLEWWQVDVNAYVIRALQACGLVWEVKHPSREVRREARRRLREAAAPDAESLA